MPAPNCRIWWPAWNLRVAGQNGELVPWGGDIPHVCSIALPWLTADKEKGLPLDVRELIDGHKRKVDGLLQEFVRVLDGRVADDTY